MRGHKKKTLSIKPPVFPLTDNNNTKKGSPVHEASRGSHPNTNSPKSNKFEDPYGVWLGLLAAMSDPINKPGILAISPRSATNPIPILTNNKRPEDMEMCEEYTCVISHKGSKKREYFFDDQFIENGYQKKTTSVSAVASSFRESFRTADFLNACSFCQKQLQGLDIFIYRGEKAFCSSDCRCQQISIDEQKEKCGSGAIKSPECSASPCSGQMQFPAGVAVA